jgi:hypothetical protein
MEYLIYVLVMGLFFGEISLRYIQALTNSQGDGASLGRNNALIEIGDNHGK